ncbi:hypothetical protein [Methylobacterium sp. J-068]|uniref:hypothetical protein n=1 Tax=Methylobacterium sp. J-068 TaxID=2836649 RepID=UPI001FBAA4DA|nr:hypothetical protein [Methylobacterium sp. J-068]MCJ2036955.1 hypothetical protein [Methylobacterium sp. J-068]
MGTFTKDDLKNTWKSSSNADAKKFAEDVETVNNVYKILNTSIELMAESVHEKGNISGTSATMFAAKKTLAIGATAAGMKDAGEGIKVATFMGSQFLTTVEMGTEAMRLASPGRAGVYISLKVAEKVVSAVGLGNVNKCKAALASLTVNAGVSTFTCVATGGALCILGAASFALEAINTHAQCRAEPL